MTQSPTLPKYDDLFKPTLEAALTQFEIPTMSAGAFT